FIDQEHVSALVADYAGLADQHPATFRLEGGGAGGGLALASAFMAVASGLWDVVVAGGTEKMTDVGDEEANRILSSTADQEWETVFGATHAALHAMVARRHMHEFGTTREQMAAVAVKNHRNGAKNPNAQYQRELSLQAVLGAPMVADPLGMLDCAPLSDGAAAVVLCPLEMARKFNDTPVRIVGLGVASDTIALHDRRDLTTMDSTVTAGQKALKMAKARPDEVNLAEVHDNYTISEILAIEDLGFVEKGKGGPATEEGITALDGKVAVNPSGGLKALGQPVGATGIAQAVEVVRQLRGEANARQVAGAEIGLTHVQGGTGATAVVHVLRRAN
ncbi:MAG: thiolase domain-containing protein, partial [Thermoplasmata archaeon]|nr:thiolase domain-containing protein [Thermoplasmata archaeon]